MKYCPECGTELNGTEKFCGGCGINFEDKIKGTFHNAEKTYKKNKSGVKTFFVILIIAYIILNFWAATQIRPVLSADSVLNSVSNFEGDLDLTSASASTKITLENPTFVPVILFPIKYEAMYGTTEIVKGQTGMITIAPNSQKPVDFSLELSYTGAGTAAIQSIGDFITGNDRTLHIDFYELGIKFATITP